MLTYIPHQSYQEGLNFIEHITSSYANQILPCYGTSTEHFKEYYLKEYSKIPSHYKKLYKVDESE